MDRRVLLQLMAEWARDALALVIAMESHEDVANSNARSQMTKRRFWTHPYLRRRLQSSLHQGIFRELALEDPHRFRRCLRMDEEMFTFLLSKVEPILRKRNTTMRAAIPPSERLSITLRYLATVEAEVPYVFVADQGLPLSTFVMIPYPTRDLRNNTARRIYNYRLCRARVTSENAFGVLASRFLIFGSALRCDPDEACRRVKACLALHNWLRSQTLGRALHAPPTDADGERLPFGGDLPHGQGIAGAFESLRNSSSGLRHTRAALNIRHEFCEFFNSTAGSIPQQARALYRPTTVAD